MNTKGTPKTLNESIMNGVFECMDANINPATEQGSKVIEKHVRDFLANKFSGPLMLASAHAQDAVTLISALYTTVTGKEVK